MHKVNHNQSLFIKRQLRTRKKLFGTAIKPRICVHRSNQHLRVQAIDDALGKTLAASSDVGKSAKAEGKTKTERAQLVASELATQLKTKNITSAVFDRGAYRYHGRVKAVADSLRESGMNI